MVTALEDLRDARTSSGAPSARNLIVTVFGDAVLPTGDDTALSVQSLSVLLRGFGANERLVRTSLTRLVNDGLLTSDRQGRRADYRVAPGALNTFRHADQRIYRGDRSEWDGAWTTVIADPDSAGTARAALRDELAWFGFRSFGPNVWVSPTVRPDDVASLLDASSHRVAVSVTRAPASIGSDWLAARAIDVADLAERYREFTQRFEVFTPTVVAQLGGEDAFKLRTLLVASFRRIVISDPALPVDLLPDDWAEATARRVAASVYVAAASRSTEWFGAVSGLDLSSEEANLLTQRTKQRFEVASNA